MAATLDLIQRDPKNINSYLQVEFNDTFGEPDGTHSTNCLWRNAYTCFTCGKNYLYKCLTCLCCICLCKKQINNQLIY